MRKIFLFLIPILFLSLAGNALAGAADNVSGFAWSENIGWISFNCTNTASCTTVNYGVNIDLVSGKFSGHTWSENIGWISFNRAETGIPPAPPYNGLEDYIAKADLTTGRVTGWARAISYGGDWDGWIKLNDASYGVSINTSNGDFSGFAWSDEVMGWINFNNLTYKVKTSLPFNRPPSKPGIVGETWNHCSIQGRSIPIFSWTYSDPDGDPQESYEVEVDDNSSFNAPKFNHLVSSNSTSYALDLAQDDNADWISQLSWNTTYFWRVRVKDNRGNWSEWSNADAFQTPLHAYPSPDFNWTPLAPAQGEVVVFNPDISVLYGGASVFSYLWTITLGSGTFVDTTNNASQYPHIVFDSAANQIKLAITDSAGYSCGTSAKPVAATLPLPEYKEAPPASWLSPILAVINIFLTSWHNFATIL